MAATLLPYRALVAGAAIQSYTPRPPDQSKSPCHPPHHKGRRSRSERAPGQSEGRGGGRRAEEGMGELFQY
ncbi:MAG TPA: hypothetical protein VMW53_08905 [archaeon]|nr:hypothetical protein [archaeon]